MKIEDVKEQTVSEGNGQFVVIIGKVGVGKSSMAATFPKALCVDLEGTASNIKGLKRIKIEIGVGGNIDTRDKPFLELCDVTKQFLESKNYETLIIDGGLEFVKMCQGFALKGLGRKSMRDHKFGDTFADSRDAAEEYIKRTIGRGKNLVLIAHIDEVTEVDPETDEERTIYRPMLGDKRLVYKIPALASVVGMIEVDKNGKRWFNCTASKTNVLKNQFNITDKLEANHKALANKIKIFYK